MEPRQPAEVQIRKAALSALHFAGFVRNYCRVDGGELPEMAALFTSQPYMLEFGMLTKREAVRQAFRDACGPWKGWSAEVESESRRLSRLSDALETKHEVAMLEAVEESASRLLALVTFTPSELQREILAALDGVARTADELEAVLHVSRHTLFGKAGKGGLKELKELDLVRNDRKMRGYYRPDAPPSDKPPPKRKAH